MRFVSWLKTVSRRMWKTLSYRVTVVVQELWLFQLIKSFIAADMFHVIARGRPLLAHIRVTIKLSLTLSK